MNLKRNRRKRQWPNRSTGPVFVWMERKKKSRKITAKTTVVMTRDLNPEPVEIRNSNHLPKATMRCWLWSVTNVSPIWHQLTLPLYQPRHLGTATCYQSVPVTVAATRWKRSAVRWDDSLGESCNCYFVCYVTPSELSCMKNVRMITNNYSERMNVLVTL
jgi:hypothetical protein